jgi:hypothetical protein
MSSIKRDVKKKVLPRPEGEGLVSRSSPLKFGFTGEAWPIAHAHKVSSADGGDAIEFERAASQTGAQGQPWFYPRLVAYGYFWFSEGAYRVMGDSVPKHTRPTSLTDTHPRTELSRTGATTTRENPEMESPLPQRGSSGLPMQLLGVETHSFLPDG